MKQMIIALTAAFTVLILTGCPGGGGSSTTITHPVTTNIPSDNISDIQEQPAVTRTVDDIMRACSSSCATSNLVEHDDFFDIAFELLANNVRIFSFRSGWGACAIKLTGSNGGVVHADTYNKWDPNELATDRNMHFTIGKSNQSNDYCVPNGSLWEKVDCTTQSSDQIMHLRRIDKQSDDQIWISTYKGLKGTLMAKKSGILHPMACQ